MKLSDGTAGTVSVLEMEHQIASLITNPDLMKKKNIAPGLDIFTGSETFNSDRYGEIHTGRAWAQAVSKHIAEGSGNMPIWLIVYGDKSHLTRTGGCA